VRGIGLLAREADLAEIAKALQDPELEVREAAVYALGHIPSEATVEPLIDTLLEADESMRQVAAEALAKKGEKGHAILRDATKEEDLLVRRAATFGLSAVGEEWAFELLGQVERQDSQWMVRSAATEALQRAKKTQQAAAKLDLSPLSLDEQGWLVEWGATRGMSVGLGRTAMPVLMRALAEGDAQVKLAAIRTIARMGDADMIIHLRPLLGEPDPTLRAAAFRTIAEISARTGKVVPA
jgi:HEAT repeat protein